MGGEERSGLTDGIWTKQGMRVSQVMTTGWQNAVIGMRLPMNSEAQSDSTETAGRFVLGPKDKDLIIRLTKAGTDHSKVLRMIHVQALIKMPLTWWKHYDTYKVATTAISRSTMHKAVGGKELTKNDFFVFRPEKFNWSIITKLNDLQDMLKAANDESEVRGYWERIIDMLPNAYCQERMIDLNYQTLLAILGSRYGVEKLDEPWNFFCEAMIMECPHLGDIYDAVKHKRSMTTLEFEAMKKNGK